MTANDGSRRRVLILDENLPVPFDRRVWRESTALREADYQVSVVCPRGASFNTEFYSVIDGVRIYRFPTFEAGSGFMAYLLEYTQALCWMSLLTLVVFIRHGFDVIQLCNPPDLLFLIALPYKLLGKKVIFDHHDLSPETYRSKSGVSRKGPVERALLFFERQTFRFADVVMSTNESYKRFAVQRGRKNPDDVVVVRNGPDLSRFKTVDADDAFKKGKDYLIFYVGNMSSQDGVDYLMRAVNILHHQRDDFHVLIIGGGTELNALRKYSSELSIDNVVTFAGRVADNDMLIALSTADVCVCPDPKNELNDVSTMQKTLEYMAMGKPIVAFDLKETYVSAGDGALYAKDNSEEDFARQVSRLLDSADLRLKMGRSGRSRVVSGLSWEDSKQHLYRAYDMAFAKSRGRGIARGQ